MKVSTTQPFAIVYAIYQHEYLGYLFESFVVQLNSRGDFTFVSQNISSQNAQEFAKNLDEKDFKLIKLIEQIQQKNIIKKFSVKRTEPQKFFGKIYNPINPDKPLREVIEGYIEDKKQKILPLLQEKNLFIMAKDGTPTGARITFAEEPTSVLFHFRRNEKGTHYFPTLKYKGKKLDFQFKNAMIIGNEPAWMILHDTLHYFAKNVDGKKLIPFLRKNHIAVSKEMESTYYQKFVASLIASFDVYAEGFSIKSLRTAPKPILAFAEHTFTQDTIPMLETKDENQKNTASRVVLSLNFQYGKFLLKLQENREIEVQLETVEPDGYNFYKIKRDFAIEQEYLQKLESLGFSQQNGKVIWEKAKAFEWLGEHEEALRNLGIQLDWQKTAQKYFIGKPSITLEIKENNDWLDIHARIKFGEFEISFLDLRKIILKKQAEFPLPDGKIAVIPEHWFAQLTEFFNFSEESDNAQARLRKYHLPLVQNLQNQQFARLSFNKKLEALNDFQHIDDYAMPVQFKGELRSYQKAGYNWLRFLDEYNFGGCLADDMGLGKTAQALALLQAQKEKETSKNASILIIPTSLIYNWQLEAKKFTPELKIYLYVSGQRRKSVEYFQHYDLIITSYGVARLDSEILEKYYFNYIILDESQAIKNPDSNIAQAVKRLKSRNKLILTGTPLENSVLDLWSQISFVNPGLLGSKAFFKNQFLNPIEKQSDTSKTEKLAMLIKPFILRRHKSQVATDLPEKVENLQYCTMSKEQEKFYEEIKAQYRNKILENLENFGSNHNGQMLLIQGLTKLRQIANHPKMIDDSFEGGSGKLEDVFYKLESIVHEKSKVLVFSQFVKHLELLRTQLDDKKWKYAYLTGSTVNRQAEVEKFQYDPQVPIFLISLKAGGVGLNLTAAEYVFLLDPWWNPATENQAVDRAHRIGQTKTVFTYKFITKNTVEEKILALQANKQRLAQELITNEEQFYKKLTREDVMSLLD